VNRSMRLNLSSSSRSLMSSSLLLSLLPVSYLQIRWAVRIFKSRNIDQRRPQILPDRPTLLRSDFPNAPARGANSSSFFPLLFRRVRLLAPFLLISIRTENRFLHTDRDTVDLLAFAQNDPRPHRMPPCGGHPDRWRTFGCNGCFNIHETGVSVKRKVLPLLKPATTEHAPDRISAARRWTL
jgi:hypothetical protein